MSDSELIGDEEHYQEPLPPHDDEQDGGEAEFDEPKLDEMEIFDNDGSDQFDVFEAYPAEMYATKDLKTTKKAGSERGKGKTGADDESDDEGFVVTIGQLKPNMTFTQKAASNVGAGKLDMDGTPTVNGEVIYDLDLAQMEDRPWMKPGADITDYFNYGFNEGGRQLQTIPIIGQEKPADLNGPKTDQQQPIMRTVLTGQAPRAAGSGGTVGTSKSVSSVSVIDGTSDGVVAPLAATPSGARSPDFKGGSTPDFTKPPPVIDVPSVANKNDGPPGVDEPAPPGSSTPPLSFSDICASRPIPSLGSTVNTSVPPPGFNPLLPPPGINQPPAGMRMGLTNNFPPSGFTVPPPTFGQPPPGFPPSRFGSPAPLSRPPPLMGRPAFPPAGVDRRDNRDNEDRDRDRERGRDRDRDHDKDRGSGDSGDEEHTSRRSRYRRRSRSYSPRLRRHRDDRGHETEKHREKDRERESRSSRRHRSKTVSPYESSRSSRRKEEKEKEKKKSRVKEESGSRIKDEPLDERDEEKKDSGDRKKDDAEKSERERDKERDRDRKRRRHNRSDDESSEKRDKDKDRKRVRVKDEPPN